MTVKVLILDETGDPIDEAPNTFDKVKQAQKWCETNKGEKLEWGEDSRWFSLEGMTKEEREKLGETFEFPPFRYWICGVDENGDCELAESDFEEDNEGA